ncbi:DUF6732 family protein [Pseudohoeflea coraliihabitans]|uniref:LPXTG cell wall anchor domain-containing protein n=1 Tax=Pseudohoeflea coraliihabitans TaxID=2860393 RepID=A0ABS6WII1_9HYPH|nr:DUF6732 family protein [Pseudohoeflea sp. DP4N28-3]MBW3095749.1 hypothetical protein [Pseudohoeflea sp. DP4N28-3]
MRQQILAFLLLILPVSPALAHGGHLGELAGHSHWLGWAAVAAAAGLAAWARKKRRRSRSGGGEQASVEKGDGKARGGRARKKTAA